MKLSFLSLLLAAMPAVGGDRPMEVLPAVLYTTYQQPASVTLALIIEDEVESIMGPLGRHFAWRSISGVKGNEVSAELAVLTFKGHCDLSTAVKYDPHPGALGWTHVTDGAILPFAEIDCDRIHSFINRELLFLKPEEREPGFGRAVARVVAHELYHIFANTQHHGSDGVGKSAYSVQELLSDGFQFEEHEGRALRATTPPVTATTTSIRHTVSTP